jgi:hypothetical protein
MDSQDPDTAAANPPTQGRRQLLRWLARAAVAGLLAIGTVVWVSARYGLEAFTAAEPLPLAPPQMSAADGRELEEKLADFSSSFRQGEAATLELSGPEINTVIEEHVHLQARLAMTIDDGRLQAQVSVPLEPVIGPRGKGRWLNGEATLDIAAEGGQVRLRVTRLVVNGRLLPRPLLDALARHNLAADAASDAATRDYVRRVESVTVTDRTIVLQFKAS